MSKTKEFQGEQYSEWKFPIFRKLNPEGTALIKLISQNEFLTVATAPLLMIQYSDQMNPAQCADTLLKTAEITMTEFVNLFTEVSNKQFAANVA